MKRHGLDRISLVAGIVFAGTAGFWLINWLADEPISPAWTAVGVLVLVAAIIVVSAIPNHPETPEPSPATTEPEPGGRP